MWPLSGTSRPDHDFTYQVHILWARSMCARRVEKQKGLGLAPSASLLAMRILCSSVSLAPSIYNSTLMSFRLSFRSVRTFMRRSRLSSSPSLPKPVSHSISRYVLIIQPSFPYHTSLISTPVIV